MTGNSSASSVSWASPGQGITGGYMGNSLTLKVFICFFAGLAMYNAIELAFMIFLTFQRYRGRKQTDGQQGNSNHVVATWSLISTELTLRCTPVLVLDMC